MKDLDWQSSTPPNAEQSFRMYEVYSTDATDTKDAEGVMFDPESGIFYMLSGRTWLSSIQTFQPREVHNK